MNKFSGESRRFGFVNFQDPETVQKVLKEEHCLDGEFINVEQAYEDRLIERRPYKGPDEGGELVHRSG